MNEHAIWKENFIKKYSGNHKDITDETVEEIIKRFTEKYPNKSTMLSSLSKFKRLLLEKTKIEDYKNGYEYNKEMLMSHKKPTKIGNIRNLKLPEEDAQMVYKKQQDRKSQRSEKNINVKHETVEKILNLVSSKNPREVCVGLLLATGRRLMEVVSNATFKRDGKSKDTIIVSGLLKGNSDPSYRIKTLLPPVKILNAVKKIRQELPKENITLNSDSMNVILGRILKKIDANLYIHALRSIYVDMIFKTMNKENYTKSFIIEKDLCHSNRGTTDNYNYYNVVF